ncbi:MAG: glycosyltransferase family 2 protein [Methanobacteriaceae archaeon]|nr:glycosyltransferase family 2 protein [Methanobacteriaceae archaeon]
MDLSIIIVNYQTYKLTKNTIKSILESKTNLHYEIILVDNASQDDSIKKLKIDYNHELEENILKIIENSTNEGFAKANNKGIKKSTGKYILLLNSDTILKKDTITKTVNYIQKDSTIGILGCKVLLPNNSLDKACRRSFPTIQVSFYRMSGLSKIFPNSKKFNQYNLSYLDKNKTYEVDCVTGAFMLIPSEILNKAGFLDETYFMYGEDIDLCYTIKQMGYKVVYYGSTSIIHYKGSSGHNKKTLYEFYNSMQIFYDKYYKKEHSFPITIIAYTSIWGLYIIKYIILQMKSIYKYKY